MDWVGLTINLIAIFAGLGIYIGIMKSKWGEKHQDMQYALMLLTILLACVIGGILRVLAGLIL